jgi:hypothetical protein
LETTIVARKSKIEPEKGANAADSNSAAENVLGAGGPKKKARSAAAKPKPKKPAAKKKAQSAPPSTNGEKTSAPAAAAEPTDEAIRIRAYFLAERRHRLSLPGDSAHDWIEARRQLIEESGR